MMILIDRLRLGAALGAFLIGTGGTAGMGGALAADDVSRWDGDARSAARLVAGSQVSGARTAVLRAGVEIRLKRGWHTYWRYPGDAGVPPQFDFKGSRNVKSIEVLWPAPRRLVEDGGTSIGYVDDLILPLRIVPQDAAKPVALSLKLDYAICEKLCVPAQAKAELPLPKGAASGSTSQDAALAAAEARVPQKRTLGEGGPLIIQSVRREAGPTRPRVVVDLAAPADQAVELFAEGPTAHWALPVPAPVADAPAGHRRFAFELDGLPPGASDRGVPVTLTAVTPGHAIEVVIRLD
jgi:DsbC/DsbD-like thiol-disulfide interchange protein